MIILTEKPSVALEFAKTLGCKKEDGYFLSEATCIVFAYGHLLELYEPHDYDPALQKWRRDSLPIIPEHMKYKAIAKTKKQLDVVKACFEKYGDRVLLATDAEREGELIGATILQYVGFRNYENAKRFWVSEALTPDVIKKGIANAKPLTEYAQYRKEGFARQHADWLVGINLTRFLSIQASTLLTFGRVQTAVLNAIRKREDEIKNFQREKYFQLEGLFEKDGRQFKGLYTAEKNNRFLDRNTLEDVLQKIGTSAVVENREVEKKRELPPLLYNLTGLQKDASQAFDFSPETTLNIAQSLYEKHKCLSYPRTPSRVMGDDNVDLFIGIYTNLRDNYTGIDFIQKSSRENLDQYKKRIFDSSSLTDHHALIPLKPLPADATENEEKIYVLVLKRFFQQFMNPHLYNTETITLNANGNIFIAKGKQILEYGWKEEKEMSDEEKEQSLPGMNTNDTVTIKGTEILEKYTEPKKYYTEATLLQLMENPRNKEGKKIVGIGTPATRANIIATLFNREYIRRERKNIRMTDKGNFILDTCYQDKNLTSFIEIETTTEWEEQLSENQAAFMQSIKSFLHTTISNSTLEVQRREEASLGQCPVCKKEIRSGKQNYYCSGYKEGCKFSIWKTICGARITDADLALLLAGKKTRSKKMKNKAGKEFQAALKLDKDKIIFDFDTKKK